MGVLVFKDLLYMYSLSLLETCLNSFNKVARYRYWL